MYLDRRIISFDIVFLLTDSDISLIEQTYPIETGKTRGIVVEPLRG